VPQSQDGKLSLVGSVSLGTGVMIGAGIFALVGQVAELAGTWMPLAFVAGAVVVGFSAYSYVRYSSANPSSGGIAMILTSAYGPGVIAGSFSLFMYVSMVIAQSILGRTFGTYVLRPFGQQDSTVLVPALGVVAIAAAALVNLLGNRWVEGSATVTAAVKIVGIAALAIAGILASGVSAFSALWSGTAEQSDSNSGLLGFLASITLCVLAYKGFTTITNQGADLREPERNLGRSITLAILLCTVLYLLITVAVAGSLDVPQIVEARDYALAAAAEPLFGVWGTRLTVAVAVVATLSGLLASIYAVSRLYDMLLDMQLAPGLPSPVRHQSLVITAGLAILVTVFLDLTQLAALGALLYLSMDIAIHAGLIRHLHQDVDARRWVPAVAILLDLVIVIAFIVVKLRTDPLTLMVVAAVAGAVVLLQVLLVRHRARTEDQESETNQPHGS